MSEECPLCGDKDLSGMNDTNKDQHLMKSKMQHPYPKIKPSKRKKQSKISFLPAPQAPVASVVEDFVVKTGEVVEVVNEEPVGIEWGENPVSPIPSFDDELQEVGEHSVAPIPPPLVCEDLLELPKFFENFPFQLLPFVPHVVLSGETSDNFCGPARLGLTRRLSISYGIVS